MGYNILNNFDIGIIDTLYNIIIYLYKIKIFAKYHNIIYVLKIIILYEEKYKCIVTVEFINLL